MMHRSSGGNIVDQEGSCLNSLRQHDLDQVLRVGALASQPSSPALRGRDRT